MCSLSRLDSCSDDDKKLIDDFRKKSKEELETEVLKVEKEMEDLNSGFEKEIEKLQELYQSILDEFNTQTTKVKEESNYKWLTKVFIEKGGGFPEDDELGMGDEF